MNFYEYECAYMHIKNKTIEIEKKKLNYNLYGTLRNKIKMKTLEDVKVIIKEAMTAATTAD
jgi:hypothetical protein